MHSHAPAASPGVESWVPKIQEYVLPKKNCLPYGIGVDSKGRIWYSAQAANLIGYLDPETGQMKEFEIPSTTVLPKSDWKYDPVNKETPKPEDTYNIFSLGSPGELIVDQEDRVWFVQTLGNSLGMFDPEKEKFIEYQIPTPDSQPYSLVQDKKNNIWFVERNANKIGKLDFSVKKVIEYSFPGGSHRLSSIAADDSGGIWVTDISDNSLGLFQPSEGKIKRFPVYEDVSQPQAIILDQQGRPWFVLAKARKIGMLEPKSGKMSFALIPGYNSVPQDIALDAKGRVWYVDSMRNRIGYFDPDKAGFDEWGIPTTNSQPMQMVFDKEGNAWFTESDRNANKIGKLVVSSLAERESRKEEAPVKAAQGKQERVNKADGGNGVEGFPSLGAALLAIATVAAIIFFAARKR